MKLFLLMAFSLFSALVSAGTPPHTGGAEPSAVMSSSEQAMLNEINMLRADPASYVKFIDLYIEGLKAEIEDAGPRERLEYEATILEAQRLIEVLNQTAPLPAIEARECVYKAARIHGEEEKAHAEFGHQGRDGSWPWERMAVACPDIESGGENLVGGPRYIRDAIIVLLVDYDIEGHGHRDILLDPEWKYAACYFVGDIGEMPNCWVQNFAK